MNKRVNISVKTFLIVLAVVAIAAWLAGCTKPEQGGIVQQGVYEGQNAIEVLENKGMFVQTSDLKNVCRYVDKLSRDGSIDGEDILALGELVSNDTGIRMNVRNGQSVGNVIGIGVLTYCPELYPLFSEGSHI